MKGKRILALALSVVLILGVFPVSVFADGPDIHVDCPHCGEPHKLTLTWEDFYEGIASDFLDFLLEEDKIKDCFCCIFCVDENHCAECGECFYQDWLCPECNCCWACLDEETHCPECTEHTELCEDCLDVGVYRCRDCHDDRRRCPGCGTCVEALAHSGELCCGYNDSTPHCTECHEDWVCDDCGQCFYDFRDAFCESCGLCIDCAVDDGLHC